MARDGVLSKEFATPPICHSTSLSDVSFKAFVGCKQSSFVSNFPNTNGSITDKNAPGAGVLAPLADEVHDGTVFELLLSLSRNMCNDFSSSSNSNSSTSHFPRIYVERQGLQLTSNGVSNQCLDSAANVLPDAHPPSTVAALASIANTVPVVPRDNSSLFFGLGPLSISTPSGDTIFDTSGPLASSTHFPCDISTSKRQKLGNPFAFNSSNMDDGVHVQHSPVNSVSHNRLLNRGISDQSSSRDERDGACPPGALDVDSPVPLWLTRLFHPPNA